MAITMSSTLPILSAICFTFIQIILMNIARGESSTLHSNPTHHASQWKSAEPSTRSSQEITLDRLKLQVQSPNGENFELNWIKIDNHLANQYLPVIAPYGYLKADVMEDVGEFSIYHDVEKCSAVVYFEKSQSLFGVVGLDYIITNLPYKFDANGNYPELVREPHFARRAGSNTDGEPLPCTIDEPEKPPDTSIDCACGTSRVFSANPGPNIKHHHTIRVVEKEDHGYMPNGIISRIKKRRGMSKPEYYLEILVFVTSDVVEFFKFLYNDEMHIEWVVRYYILYFNAIDMNFKKMRSTEVELQINIAKIVIEDSERPFPFLIDNELQFGETVVNLREYLETHQYMFTTDSFDHVFMFTRRSIIDQSAPVLGATDIGGDLFLARQQEQFYSAVPISIIGFSNDYSLGAMHISQTFDIEMDLENEKSDHPKQCKHDRCLNWSEDNKKQFNEFFRTNHNRCFLLNEPRSVRRSGPSKLITPSNQCRCFGYSSFPSKYDGGAKDYVEESECELPLQCTELDEDQSDCDYALQPFDGTACGTHMVCWEGKCTKYERKRCSRPKLLKRLLGRFL